MSARSGRRPGLFLLAAALAAVAGCGTSGPRPPDPAADEVVAVAAEADAPAGTEAAVPPVEVPERAAAIHARALAAMAAEDWLSAKLELEQLIAEYPSFAGPHVNLAIVYRREGRDDEAEAALGRALEIAPGHAVANNELGVLYREQGEFGQAEAAYRRAIAGDPEYALAHYNLGVLLDLYLRRETEALEQYEIYQALLPEPDSEVGRWVVDLRRRLGLPADTVQVAQEDGR